MIMERLAMVTNGGIAMAKLSFTFEEGDEVALARVETVERLGNRLLDMASTILPTIAASQARRQASPPADVVTHARSCACRFCKPRSTGVDRDEVRRLMADTLEKFGLAVPKAEPGPEPGTPSEEELKKDEL